MDSAPTLAVRRSSASPPLSAAQALSGRPTESEAEARRAVNLQETRGWKAREDSEPTVLLPPIDWLANPFRDANWLSQLNCWRPLDVYINLHDQTGDRAAFDRLTAGILDWIAYEADAGSPDALWGDMAAGIRASKLAYVLSRPEFGTLDPADRAALTASARTHLAKLRDPDFISDSNHVMTQIHGAAALTRVIPDAPEAEDGEAYVADLLTRALRSQFGVEGVHLEHSPTYHVYAIYGFRRLATSGWHDDGELPKTLKRAKKALPWFIFPDDHLCAIGDSAPKPKTARPPALSGDTVGRLFREAGYGVVRHNWTRPGGATAMLIATCGHHSLKHKHADDLSFELFEGGRRLIVDSGKCTYDKGPLKAYARGAAAHNAIDLLEEVSDNGLRGTPPAGGGLTRLEETSWGWIIDGAFKRPAHGVRHRRRFLYRPSQWLVLLDEVEAERDRRMTAWLHLDPTIVGHREADGWRAEATTIRYVSDHPLTLTRVRGGEDPLQGWMSTRYGKLTGNDALGASWSGARQRLVTVIHLDLDRPAPTVTLGDDFSVIWDDRILEGL